MLRLFLGQAIVASSISLQSVEREGASQPDTTLARPLRDIFLIAGQSNAVGEGYVSAMPEEYKKAPSHAVMWPKFGGIEWQSYTAFGESTNGNTNILDLFGPEATFAHELSRTIYRDAGEDFGIVKVAQINTDLARDWSLGDWSDHVDDSESHQALYASVDTTIHDRNLLRSNLTLPSEVTSESRGNDGGLAPGTLFGLLVNNARMAMRSPMCANHHCRVKALLWVQGEADASSKELGSKYLENLDMFMATLRRAIDTPNLFVMVAQLAPDLADKNRHFGGFEGVSEAQQVWVQRQGWFHARLISADGLGKNPDQIHYNAKGQMELGKRFAKAYLETFA